MSAIQLTASQAEVLAQTLSTGAPNTVRVSQKESYGTVLIEMWNPEGKKEVKAA